MRSARLLHARVRTEAGNLAPCVRWGMFLLLCLFGRNIAAGYMAMLVRSRSYGSAAFAGREEDKDKQPVSR